MMEYPLDSHDEPRENLRDYMTGQRPRMHSFLKEQFLAGETTLRDALSDELYANIAVLDSLWGRLRALVFDSPLYHETYLSARENVPLRRSQRPDDVYFLQVASAFRAMYFPTGALPQEVQASLPFPRLASETDEDRQRRFLVHHQEQVWDRLLPFAYAQLTYFIAERYHAVLHDTYRLYPALFAYMLTREEFRVMFPIMCALFLQANLREKTPSFSVSDRVVGLVTDGLEEAFETTLALGMRDIARFPMVAHSVHTPTWLRAGQMVTVPYRGITLVMTRPMSEDVLPKVRRRDVQASTHRKHVRTLLAREGNTYTEFDRLMPVGSALVYSMDMPTWDTSTAGIAPSRFADELKALLYSIPTGELDVYVCMMEDPTVAENAYLLEDYCLEPLLALGISPDRLEVEVIEPVLSLGGDHEPRWCVDNTQGRTVCRFHEESETPYVYPMPVRAPK